ncbi:MAG: hypothetical protein SO471_02315 [Anaerobutyricum hallii]|nr:hypothetical protein [Anaerobutyricum hallii]
MYRTRETCTAHALFSNIITLKNSAASCSTITIIPSVDINPHIDSVDW